MRKITRPVELKPNDMEDIIEYTWNKSGYMRITTCSGYIDEEGEFEPEYSTLEEHTISGIQYDNFILNNPNF